MMKENGSIDPISTRRIRDNIALTQRDAYEAYNLIEMERVSLLKIDGKGHLYGIVICPDRQQEYFCTLQLTREGDFCPIEPDLEPKFHLAILFKFIQIRADKKSKKILKKIAGMAPEWILSKHPLPLSISFDHHPKFMGMNRSDQGLPHEQDEVFSQFTDVSTYQSYWHLQDIVLASCPQFEPHREVMAKHVLGLYAKASWSVQREAMNALLERFKFAYGHLPIVKRRKTSQFSDDVFGLYEVRERWAKHWGQETCLYGNKGIAGFCSCKDYRENSLKCCMHLAAVYLHWHGKRLRIRRFQGAIPSNGPKLCWRPDLSIKDKRDLRTNIYLLDRKEVASKLISKIQSYFSPLGTFLTNKADELAQKRKFLQLIHECQSRFKDGQLSIDPVIPQLIREELQEAEWNELFLKNKEKLLNHISALKINFYPYQREGIERALSKGKFLLADEMGLGKTIQGIAFVEALLGTGLAKKALIICPATLKAQWKKEWSMVSGREIVLVEGSPEDRKEIYLANHSVLAVNYELLLRDLDLIQEFEADLIVLDEAQRIKNFETETAKRIKVLRPFFRLILTGTPMENRPSELASLMDWIYPGLFGPNWRLNAELFHSNPENPDEKRVQNLNALRARMAGFFIRRTRKEVLDQLPSRSDCPIFLPLTAQQSDEHESLAGPVRRLMAMCEIRPLTHQEHLRLMILLTRMRMISNGMAQIEFKNIWPRLEKEKNPPRILKSLHSPKLQEFRDLIRGLLCQSDVKIVVFSQWQNMLRLSHWAIQDLLRENSIEAVFFTGRESSRKRVTNITRFHEEEQVRLFFATDAGGVGLNLQRAANICINLELSWNPAVLEQRVGRIHRIGQEAPIQVFNLISKDCIEERIFQLVQQKKMIFDELFEGKSDEIRLDRKAGFYEQVKEAMRPDLRIESEDEHQEGQREIHHHQFTSPQAKVRANTKTKTKSEQSQGRQDIKEGGKFLASPPTTTISINEIFEKIKIERTEDKLKIEASGDGAKTLANIFKMMAELFEGQKQ